MDCKGKPGSISPALKKALQRGRSLTGHAQGELNQSLRGFRKVAKKRGITVDQLFENIERTFWAYLLDPQKERLRAHGYDGPRTKQLTFKKKVKKGKS